MLEKRRHFRLRESINVAWAVDGDAQSGEGTVLNISISGVLLQLDRMFSPPDDCVVSIESQSDNFPFGLKKGKIKWFRRINAPDERLQCGVQFLKDCVGNDFIQKFKAKVDKLSEAENVNILGNLVS